MALVRWLTLLLVAASVTGPARAQDSIISDLRLGVLAHDIPILGEQHEHGADLNGEILFASPVPADALGDIDPEYRWLLRPQPHVGIEVNTVGDTSQVYLGLTWTVNLDNGGVLWPDHAVFLGIGFGPALNNGEIRGRSNDHLSLGGHILFHPSLEVGYRVTPRVAVSVYLDHSSNGGFDRYNDGNNDVGLRVGLAF